MSLTLTIEKFYENKYAHIITIIFLVLITYANSLLNGFAYDDGALLLNNKAVHGFSLGNLKGIFTSVPNNLEYLPLRDLTYMLDYSVWGLNPLGYHIANIFYYIAACLMLYAFLSLLINGLFDGACAIAFVTACLFAVHPIHVESVAGISQRKDIVSGFFFFFSMWSFMKYKISGRIGFYGGSVFLSLLALMSKSTALVIPMIVLLADGLHLKEYHETIKRKLMRAMPYFITALLSALLNILVMKKAGIFKAAAYGGIAERLGLSLKAAFLYIKMLVIPYPLTIWHPVDFFITRFDIGVLFSAAGLVILLYLTVFLWRRHRTASFSLIWYFITISPVLWFVSTHYIVSERYLFVPSLGYCLILGYSLYKWGMSRGKIARLIAGGLFTVIVFSFMAVSIFYNRTWKDNIALYMNALKYSPNAPEINASLGQEYFLKGQYKEAFDFLERARAINPVMPDYDFYLAAFHYNKGDYDTALKTLEGISSVSGMDFVDVYYLRGKIYEDMKMPEKARESYEKALRSDLTIYSSSLAKGDIVRSLSRLNNPEEVLTR